MKTVVSGWLLLIFLCSASQLSAESMTLEVIPLKHRLTEEIIPVLRPLLQPGGTITGMNNQLIIKTTPDNLAQIRSVLDSLDRSPRRLLIRVKQGIMTNTDQQEHAVSGRISTGDISAEVNDHPSGGHDGVIISGQDSEGNFIRYRGNESRINSDEGNTFMVRTTEGYPAYIAVGQSIPVSTQSALAPPGGGVIVNESTEYINADSGFYVMPRLNGDRVTLLIAPRLTKVGPGKAPVLDVQDVETTVSGRLGEWMEVGGIDRQSRQDSRELLSSSGQRGQESRSVLIRVDEIK